MRALTIFSVKRVLITAALSDAFPIIGNIQTFLRFGHTVNEYITVNNETTQIQSDLQNGFELPRDVSFASCGV